MGSSETLADSTSNGHCFNELPSVLKGALSHDATVRQSASATLEAWISIGSFGRCLLHAISKSAVVHEQQFMAVLLGKWAQNCWESGNFVGENTISEEDRRLVRMQLLQGLQSQQLNVKVQKSFIRAVATIAEMDWPEKWSELWPWFLQQCEERDTMGCAIRCMHAVLKDLSSQAVRDVVPQIFPVLASLYPQVSSELKRRIVLIIRSCYSMLEVLAQAGEESAQCMLMQAMNPWIDTFIASLQHPLDSNTDAGLHSEILSLLSRLVAEFPKQMMPTLPRIMPVVLQCFSATSSIYETYFISANNIQGSLSLSDEYDSDGEAIGVEPMIIQLLEFLRILVSSQSKRVLKFVREFFPQISSLAICYVQITHEQMEKWGDDYTSYVADEEEDSVEMNVRNVATLLLGEIERFYGARALETTTQEAQKHLNSSSWKLSEAAIVVIGKLSASYKRRVRALPSTSNSYWDGIYGMSVNGLLNHLLTILATTFTDTTAQLSFLQARALWCCALYLPFASAQQSEAFVNLLVSGLSSQGPLDMQFQACCAVHEIASTPPQYCTNSFSYIGKQMPSIIENLLQIVSLNKEETLHKSLETLSCALKVCEVAVISKCFQPLLEIAIGVWMKNISDPVVAGDCQELFKVLANIPQCLPYLVSSVKEPISAIFNGSSGNLSGIVEAAIELVILLARKTGTPLPFVFFDSIFKQIYEILRITEDVSVLQAGADCMAVYVRLGSEQVFQWKYPTGQKGGLDCIMDIISKLLHKDLEDSASLHVGNLITQVIQQLGNKIQPETVRELVAAVIERLSCAKSPCLIQSLCLVFSRLLHSHGLAVVHILCELNALEFVLSTWLFWQPEFYGTLDLNVSLASLTLLYSMQDPHLEGLTVKGDVVEAAEVSGRRMRTRSQKKGPEQYEQVPLHIRLLTIIIRSARLLTEEEDDAGLESSSDESESGDEWNKSFESDMADNNGGRGDIEVELQSDPLFAFDVKGHLLKFLKGLTKEEAAQNALNQLKGADKASLQRMLSI